LGIEGKRANTIEKASRSLLKTDEEHSFQRRRPKEIAIQDKVPQKDTQ
jgi:hypothetical protein